MHTNDQSLHPKIWRVSGAVRHKSVHACDTPHNEECHTRTEYYHTENFIFRVIFSVGPCHCPSLLAWEQWFVIQVRCAGTPQRSSFLSFFFSAWRTTLFCSLKNAVIITWHLEIPLSTKFSALRDVLLRRPTSQSYVTKTWWRCHRQRLHLK